MPYTDFSSAPYIAYSIRIWFITKEYAADTKLKFTTKHDTRFSSAPYIAYFIKILFMT